MKKYLVFIFISIIAILSCEKDDICIEPTTPKLIITFYNKDTTYLKKQVKSLTVWANSKDSLYVNKSLDSIAIPLDVNSENTLYKFVSTEFETDTDDQIDTEDEINFAYNRNDIFISRSCGYKTIYENLTIESNTENWINSIVINNSTIENETATHIIIFH
ncbi:DUF6452 family protein [Lutibacter sp. B1]|uniref:DUF6452 family protein n=1 Tax=Lutibacter sp. B1 TaxID=2725996 RepID=UPI0014570234|nr:DUF6452 family protein [Lutibacter sp. B1]NLP56943.1 hypothetical protein [Lutibacter sp. B1]